MILDENTKVKLGAVAGAIGVMIGFAMWLSALWWKVEATAETIQKLESKEDQNVEFKTQVIDRLGRIETKLDSLKK